VLVRDEEAARLTLDAGAGEGDPLPAQDSVPGRNHPRAARVLFDPLDFLSRCKAI
jgi:hypothetical protein